jgi:PAS domain-containing protein
VLTVEQARSLIRFWDEIALSSETGSQWPAIVRLAVDMVRAEQASIGLIRGNYLEIVAATQGLPSASGQVRLSLNSGILGKTAFDGKVRRIAKGRYESPISGVGSAPGGNTRAMVCVPLLHGEWPIGTLQVFGAQERDGFSEGDEHALLLLARQAAFLFDRRRLQDLLLQESSRIKGIFEALTDGVMVVDADGNPIIYNQAVEDLFFPGGQSNYALTTYLHSIAQKAESHGTTEVVLLKPHEIILSNRYVALRESSGSPREMVLSMRNITEQRATERNFSQFYALTLHQAARVLKRALKEKETKQRRKWLRRHQDLVRHLVALTDIRSGPLRIERENLDLLELYRLTRARFGGLLRRRGLTVDDRAFLESGPVAGRFDRRRCLEVLAFFFRYSLKALAPGGTIELAWVQAGRPFEFMVTWRGRIRTRAVLTAASLDWKQQMHEIIGGVSSGLDLDPALAAHIVGAHKGTMVLLPVPSGAVPVPVPVPARENRPSPERSPVPNGAAGNSPNRAGQNHGGLDESLSGEPHDGIRLQVWIPGE